MYIPLISSKGSYDVAKKNIILCIWCNAMYLCGLRFTKYIIFHILYIIVAPLCPPFWNASIFTKLIVLRSEACSDWPAIQCIVIGRMPQAWDGNVPPLPYCEAVSQRNNTKTIKPIINEAFVASIGDIITDYNDLYCLFTRRIASRCIAPHKYYHVCISAWRNDKRYSTLLKTHVAFISSRNVITGFESETSDCPSKFGIAPLYRNSLCASQHCRLTLLFQVQKTVLRKMYCTVHTL